RTRCAPARSTRRCSPTSAPPRATRSSTGTSGRWPGARARPARSRPYSPSSAGRPAATSTGSTSTSTAASSPPWRRGRSTTAGGDDSGRDESGVLGVLPDELGHVPARGHDPAAARADVVERVPDQLLGQTTTAPRGLDEGVREDERLALVAVVGDAHDLA